MLLSSIKNLINLSSYQLSLIFIVFLLVSWSHSFNCAPLYDADGDVIMEDAWDQQSDLDNSSSTQKPFDLNKDTEEAPKLELGLRLA